MLDSKQSHMKRFSYRRIFLHTTCRLTMDKTVAFRAKCLKSLMFIVKLTQLLIYLCRMRRELCNDEWQHNVSGWRKQYVSKQRRLRVPDHGSRHVHHLPKGGQTDSAGQINGDRLFWFPRGVRTITIKLGEHDLYRYRMLHQIELCRKEQRNSLQLKCHHVLKFLTSLFIRYGKNYASKVYLVWHFNIINK